MRKDICLSVSLFSSKINWSYILNEGIIPFLNKLSVENKRPSFLIGFNCYQGENIRFSISAQESDADSLAGEIETYFKKMFLISVRTEKENLLPGLVTDLFRPFAENTIQYGLYRPIEDNEDESAINLKKILSVIILDALKEEDINDREIGTLAFYLTIALLNVIGKNAYVSEKEIVGFYKKTDDEKIDDGIHSEFIKNKESLAEIAHTIIYKEDTEEWLSRWEQSLEKILRKATDTKEVLRLHNLIIPLIYMQLNISDHRKTMLNYFIDQLMLAGLKNEIFKDP